MAKDELEPLMAATDDEEDIQDSEVTEAKELPLLSDTSSPDEVRRKKRLQLYNLLSISIIAMLWSTISPIQYNDISAIWTGSEESTFSSTTFLCQLVFLLAFVASTYLSPIVIPFLGTKRTMLLGTVNLALLTIAHFFSYPYLLLTAYALVGFQMNFFYTALSVCCSQLAQRFCSAKLTPMTNYERIHVVFQGAFHAFLLGGPLLRTLFVVLLLQPGSAKAPLSSHCGTKYCLGNKYHGLTFSLHPLHVNGATAHRIQALFGAFLTLALAAVLITATCLYLPHKLELRFGLRRRCAATRRSFAHLWQMNFALLVPIFIFMGSNQALYYHVVSRAYVGCVWYERWSDYFIICMSGFSLLASVPLALLCHTVGRTKAVIVCLLLSIGLLLVLLLLTPSAGNTAVMFAVAGVAGLLDALLQTQLSAQVSGLFWNCRITAHCSYRMWQALGILIVVVLHRFFCVLITLSTVMALLVLAGVSYVVLEIRLCLASREEPHHQRGISMKTVDEGGWIPKLNPHSRNNRASLIATSAQ